MPNNYISAYEERYHFLKESYDKLEEICPDNLRNDPIITKKMTNLKNSIDALRVEIDKCKHIYSDGSE